MISTNDYGMLITKDIKLHRQWFKEMVRLHGIICKYKAPKNSKEFDEHGELDPNNSNYYPEEEVGVIFSEHPDQKTLKKMGWVAELGESSLLIHVPYDLPHLEVGALFIIPAGIDGAAPRTFRVISMQTIMIYPASVTCEIAPEYESTEEKSQLVDFTGQNFTVLMDNEEDD